MKLAKNLLKCLILLSVLLSTIGCCKDKPECIHPEFYGVWDSKEHHIHVNREDVYDTLFNGHYDYIFDIKKNTNSFLTDQGSRIDTLSIAIDSVLFTVINHSLNDFTFVYDIKYVSQDSIVVERDGPGRVGDIETYANSVYTLIK